MITKLMQGDVSAAGDELVKAVKLSPDNHHVLLAQAHVQIEKDQFEDAVKTLERLYAFDRRASTLPSPTATLSWQPTKMPM